VINLAAASVLQSPWPDADNQYHPATPRGRLLVLLLPTRLPMPCSGCAPQSLPLRSQPAGNQFTALPTPNQAFGPHRRRRRAPVGCKARRNQFRGDRLTGKHVPGLKLVADSAATAAADTACSATT